MGNKIEIERNREVIESSAIKIMIIHTSSGGTHLNDIVYEKQRYTQLNNTDITHNIYTFYIEYIIVR